MDGWRHLYAAAACGAFLVLVFALSFFALVEVPPPHPWEHYDPEDDAAWAAISPEEVSWADLEPLEGASAERVIETLGPPIHARRRTTVSDRCAAVYLYPVRTGGKHSTVGLCITPEGRVEGSVGQHRFNLRTYGW